MPGNIFNVDRSVVIAADGEGRSFPSLVEQTRDVAGVSAYKLGFMVALSELSLPRAVETVKTRTNKLAIYDHQKAGNDIPDTAAGFAKVLKAAEVDAAILFPFNGPDVLEAWVKALQDQGIGVMLGSEMTHKNQSGPHGFIRKDAFKRMFDQAAELGVADFVFPGNKPDRVIHYRKQLERQLGVGRFTVSSPGLIAQGGDITAAGLAAGEYFHGIIGRAVFEAEDIGAAAAAATVQIVR